MITKLKNILKGWYFDLFDKNNYLYNDRIKLCKRCDHHEDLGCNLWVCDICGCITSKKTRVEEEKCPIDKW